MKYYGVKCRNYLEHHGILGMEWGKRNGPPYPLGSGDHSSSEKKAGWRASLKNSNYAIKKNKIAKRVKTQDKVEPIAKRDIDRYREYLKKKDPESAKSIDKISDDELQSQITRRREIAKRIAIFAAAGIGIGACCYIEYKTGIGRNLIKSIKDMNGGVFDPDLVTTEIVQAATKETYEDVDFCLNAGDELQKVVGVKDFDLNKASKYLYVTNDPNDNYVYQTILNIRNAEKGVRENVTLKAVNEIKAPSLNKMKKIIQDELLNNDEYLDKLQKTIDDHYSGIGFGRLRQDIRKISDDEKINQAIWAMARGNGDADMVANVIRKQGFNAMLDLHDINAHLGRTPLILLNSQEDVVKIGQQAVNVEDVLTKVRELGVTDPDHPITKDSITWQTINLTDVETFKKWLGL